MNHQERMVLAQTAAREAGNMLKNFQELHVEVKARNDFVTDADRAAERLIRQILLSACPQDGFYGEESGHSGANASGQWVVDPIDGTTNFIHDLHPYTISIAYMENGHPLAGAIYAPKTDEMFGAYLGGGAFLNGKPIHVADIDAPGNCLLGMSFAHRNAECAQRMFRLIPRLAQEFNDMRRLGSAAYDLCCVASGRYGAFIELNLNLYDIAAGTLIAREAGATVGGWPGSEDCLISGDVLACAPALHEWFMQVLSE